MRVEVDLLGGFTVRIDGVPVPAGRFRRRSAAALVKLLAMAPRGRLHRDRVIDALWPDLDVETALPRLHKSAHFARDALGFRDGVVLRDETVALFPHAELTVDVAAFDAATDAALRGGDATAGRCREAAARYRGELLPDDLGEAWTEEPRLRLRSRYLRLLRGARMWPEVLALEPADEAAHVESLREAVLTGDRAAALRRYERMERILASELGVAPSPEAVALRERALAPAAPPPPAAPAPPGAAPSAGAPPAPPAPAAHPGPAPARRPAAPGPALLERDEELAGLLRTVRAAQRTGRGGVVLLAGEPGSGKSALVRAFVERLDGGTAVAVGGCDDLLAPRSLGPFRDMAADLPELGWALSAGTAPDDVLAALLRVLSARPSVLVVEDVHWADDATLDAVRYLSRRVPGIPAVLLLTFRDEELGATHPLRRVLGGLAGPAVRRIELGPLSVAAVRRLGGLPEAEAAEIHRVTKGNAFFVTEVLDAGGDGVPATVRDAVLARVGRLSPAARELADLLAVVPSRVERWLAEALADAGSGGLTDLERSGVVTGGTEHVAFRHELARRALEASLTVGERVRANRAVLEVLLRQPPVDPSRVVHHAVRAARTDVLLEHGPAAAAGAERQGAHRQAAEILRAVLDHAGTLEVAARARLLTRRAYSLYVVNEYDLALADAEAAVAAAGAAGEAAVLGEALTVLSRIAFFAKGPMTARGAAQRAVRTLAGGDDAQVAQASIELARTHSNLATVGVLAQPGDEAVRYAERALALADRLRRDDLRAQALSYRGGGRLARGDAGGLADVEAALALGAGETRLETRVRAFVNAAGCTYRAGRAAEARRYVAAGLRLAADGEFVAGQYRLNLTAAAVAASTGDWEDALAGLRAMLSAPGNPGVMALLARSLLARLLARRGDADSAAVLAAAQRDPAAATADSYVAGPLAVARVELDWLTGRGGPVPAQARAALDATVHCGHTAMRAELCGYLRRAGYPVEVPAQAPGPWAAALAGDWRGAAAGWGALGERYEQAVELAGQREDATAREAGLASLSALGAVATVARLRGA